MNATDSVPFKVWMHAVDRTVERLAGLSRDDLPDCPYADWYEDGVMPGQAARRAIRGAQQE